ncbi:MAG: ABC transporter substrate-binding protein [Betaproteobacteria bacterium]
MLEWPLLRCMLVLASLGLSLVSLGAQPIAVRDDAQQELRLERPPVRVVSLLPALTESMCALGQCHRLVGVDRYSNWPAAVQSLPRMGGGLDVNLEAVVAQRPDLVLMATSSPGRQRLQSLGIPVLALEPRTHDEVRRNLSTLAQVFALPTHAAQAVWRDLDAALSAAAQTLPPQLRGQRVYVEVGSGPFGASESSFIGQTLSRLGLANILPGSLGPFPQIQSEFVVRAQPDVIVISRDGRDSMVQRPGWALLRAVQQGRVCALSPADADVLMRPGPRLAEAAQLLVGCLLGGAR